MRRAIGGLAEQGRRSAVWGLAIAVCFLLEGRGAFSATVNPDGVVHTAKTAA